MKILIVEDITNLFDSMEVLVKNVLPHAEVTRAIFEKQAIDCIAKNNFNLILLDGKLEHPMYPKGHGKNVFALMTEDQKKITVINSAEMGFVTEIAKQGYQYLSRKNNEEEFEEILKKLS
jgi:response regulator of citrate/malate metabolism